MDELEKQLAELEAQLNTLSGNFDLTMQMANAIAIDELRRLPEGSVFTFEGLGAIHQNAVGEFERLLDQIRKLRAARSR